MAKYTITLVNLNFMLAYQTVQRYTKLNIF